MKKKSLTEIAADDIIKLIQINKMRPGEKVKTEFELAEKLNVGRGTIREAIKLLVSRNILEVRQGSGTFVSPKQGIPIDPLGLTFVGDQTKLAADLAEIRLMLEPDIAALAAAYATKDECKRIMEQCDHVEELIHEERDYGQQDVEYHKLIAEASGNKVIVNLIPIIHSSVLININLTNNELKEHTCKYHRMVAESIARGDVQGAKYAMMMHVNQNREDVMEKYNIKKERK